MTVSPTPQSLRQLDLFADCADDDLELVASLLSTAGVARGGVLMHEGDPGDELMILGHGEASVSKAGAGGGQQQIDVLPGGSVVGELSLLGQGPRSATVTALVPLQVFVCDRRRFGALLSVPGVGARLAAIAARRRAANRMVATLEVPVALEDGALLHLRPICPADKPKLVEGMARLSPESRRRRFFSAKETFNAATLAYLTELDYHDHFAWAALADGEPGRPIVGVARYIRLPGQAAHAEMAMTVLDTYQGRGLGSLLFDALSVAARANGIEHFVAHVLHENAPMKELLRQAGATFDVDEPGVLRTLIDVPVNAPRLEDQGLVSRLAAAATVVPR